MKRFIFILLLGISAVAFADNYDIHDQGSMIPDDYYIHFGDDSDFILGYDEATDNNLELSDGTNEFLSVKDDGSTATFGITGDLNISGNLTAGTTSPSPISGDLSVDGDISATGTVKGATYGSDSSVSDAELLYINTLSSNAQDQIDAKQATITGAATTIDTEDLTASRALISSATGKVTVSTATSAALGYVDATSSIQTQLDTKAPLNSPTFITPTLGVASATTLNTGQGDYELYAMNQDVETTDSPTFDTVDLTGVTDTYLPYMKSAGAGLDESPLSTDGTNVSNSGKMTSTAYISGTTTVTATGPTDNLNVSNVNTVLIDTTSNNVTLGGLTGGVSGQRLAIVIINPTNNTIIENAESTGNQDFYLESGGDETKTASYGGWIFECNGTHWYQTGGGGGIDLSAVTNGVIPYDNADALADSPLSVSGGDVSASGNFSTAATSTPSITGTDSDQTDPDITWKISGNATSTGTGVEVADLTMQVLGYDTAGALGNVVSWDGSEQSCSVYGRGVTAQVWGKTVTLSTAQINALRASPIAVVAAQGANTWVELVSVVLTYDYATAAFTVGADEDFVIEYADGTDATASIETTGFIDQTDDEIRFYPNVLIAGADVEASINQGLQIFNTGSGETADGGGELDIRITYRVYPTGF